MKPSAYPTEPAHLWAHFYDITQIPRPSRAEAALRSHIQGLADRQGCSWRSDERGNLVVQVAASKGREGEAVVVIQNHLDMVTVKTDDSAHDFAADPLSLGVEQGWLSADRTTLGTEKPGLFFNRKQQLQWWM